jgi:hypothetical protein
MIVAALVVTLASHHFREPPGRFQEFNPGAGIEWCCAVWTTHLGAGAYRNSSGRATVYGVVGGDRRVQGWFYAGVEAGIALGYRRPLPLVAPYVRVGTDAWSVRVLVLPIARPILGVQVRVGV